MARVKRGVTARNRHKKVLEQAKGYYGNKSRSFRAANEQVMRSGQYASATAAPARASSAGCGSSGSTLVGASTTCPTAASSPGSLRQASQSTADPGRTRGHRSGGVRPPRGDGEGGTLSHQPELGFTNPKIQRLRRLIGRRSSRRRRCVRRRGRHAHRRSSCGGGTSNRNSSPRASSRSTRRQRRSP